MRKSWLFLLFLMTLFGTTILISCESEGPVGPSGDPVATELEGSWSGMNMDGLDYTFWTYSMHLDSIVIDGDGTVQYRGIFTVDTSVNPRLIDINITWAADAAQAGKSIPALYQMSGNILQITANKPGSSRPTLMSDAPVISLIDNN